MLGNIIKSWSSFGASAPAEQSVNPFTRQAKVPFDKKYPRIDSPLSLSDSQRLDLMPRLGFASVGTNEVDLALSRTSADIDYTLVANHVKAVIAHWREEHPTDSDAAAAQKLLEGSSPLFAIDAKAEAARLAADQAEAEHREFEKAYHEYKALPAKHEQLTGKVASLEGERLRK
jgi:hypothetical protein